MSDNVDIWLWLTMVMKPNNPRLSVYIGTVRCRFCTIELDFFYDESIISYTSYTRERK